jgi:DNA repair protein RadC
MSLQLLPFSEMPAEEKPREKLHIYGIDSLNDAELLSLIFGTGYKGMNVLELSNHLLAEFGAKGLLQFNQLSDVQDHTGLPLVKSSQLLAMAEYFRRVYKKDNTQIKSSEYLYDYVQDYFKNTTFEKLVIVCVDAQKRVLYSGVIAQGEPNMIQVSLASVFHHPIRYNAKHFFLAHNHPLGSSQASKEDIHFTLEIKKEAQKFGLSFDDHIIIGNDGFLSFALKRIL